MLNDVTISLDLNQLLGGDIDTRRTRVYVKTNVTNGTLIDTSTGETRLGDERVLLEADGTGSFTTWGVGVDGNPTSWQTSVVVEYPRAGSRDRVTRTFGPYTITDADNGKNLAELEDQQAIPAEYQTAFTQQAQSYLDAQAAIAGIDDTDSAVGALLDSDLVGPLSRAAARGLVAGDIGTPGSDIETALSASIDERNMTRFTAGAFGAKGDGSTDDTAAIDAMFAAGLALAKLPHFHFAPGEYIYNGDGIDLPANASLHLTGSGSGAGSPVTTIRLAAGKRLVTTSQLLKSIVVRDLRVFGGAGFFRSTFTGGEVSNVRVFENVYFDGYTKAAVAHNSIDSPYWHFRDCVWYAANDTTSIGVALSGDTSGSHFIGCEFLRNRVHVKLGGNAPSGGPATYFYGCDFIFFTAYSGTPRAAVWVVPNATGLTNYGGSGFTMTSCKFGNENLSVNDMRILYADQDAGGSSIEDTWPILGTASTGYINGHHFTDCQMSGGTLNPAPSLITSTTPNLTAFRITDLSLLNAWPPQIVKFLFTGADTHRNRNSVVRLAARDMGNNLSSVKNFDPATTSVSNMVDWARLEDPSGQNVWAEHPHSRTGGADITDYLDLLPGVAATAFSPTGAATLTPVTDALGGADAVEANFAASTRAFRNLTTTGSIQVGRPAWLELDVAQGASGSLTAVMVLIGDGSGNYFIRHMPLTSNYRRHRFLLIPRAQNFGYVAILPFGTEAGTAKFGRVRLYQAREPQIDSLAVRSPKTPASATAPGQRGEIAWDANYVYVCVAANTWKRAAIATW